MKTACVILNYNDAEHTLQLIDKIKDYSTIDDIVIVDNNSTDDSFERLFAATNERIHLYQAGRNGGYGAGNNFGVKCAKYDLGCDLALIANPDVSFDHNFVKYLKRIVSENENCAIASGMQRDAKNHEVMHTAWRVPTIWEYIFSTETILRKWNENFYYSLEYLHKKELADVECVAGSLLMVSVDKFLEVGGYDEEMFLYCEETTLGYKIKQAGYRSILCSDVSYQHIHGVSILKSISSGVKRKKILLKSHHCFLKKYLLANSYQLWIDSLISRVVIIEEIIKFSIRSICKK